MALFRAQDARSDPAVLEGLEGADGGAGGRKKVAASDTGKNTTPQLRATGLAGVLFVLGSIAAVAVFDTPGGPTYRPVAGVGVFALFYIVAQAVERLVEVAMPAFEMVDRFDKAGKQVALDRLVEEYYASASSVPDTGRPGEAAEKSAKKTASELAREAANLQADIDQLRADRTVIMFGLTAALGMTLCGYLEADFLTTVGAHFGDHPDVWQETLMMAVTGLIVGGGSKQLHDLITSVSKAKDHKATPTETGGEK